MRTTRKIYWVWSTKTSEKQHKEYYRMFIQKRDIWTTEYHALSIKIEKWLEIIKKTEILAHCFQRQLNQWQYHHSMHMPDLEEIKQLIKNNVEKTMDKAEMWKYASEEMIKKLHQTILNVCEREDQWLEDYSNIYSLHKKWDTIKQDVNNHRGILLLPVMYKILLKAFLNKIAYLHIGKYWGSFRKVRSCVEQIINLNIILSQCISWAKKT